MYIYIYMPKVDNCMFLITLGNSRKPVLTRETYINKQKR